MLNAINIKKFRLFQHIQVKRLARVNLIVGKNNCGKSAFLEAVELYASNASPSVIHKLVASRQETWESGELPVSRHAVRHLFYAHQLPKLGQEGIQIGDMPSESLLHLTMAAFGRERQPDGTRNRVRIHAIKPDTDLADIDLALVVENGEKARTIFYLEEDRRRSWSTGYLERSTWVPKYPCQIVPTENLSSRTIASLWDQTGLTDQEPEVIEALRLIEPRTAGVVFVEDQNRSRDRIPLVKIEGMSEPLPLKSMGDGMTRLFHIIVALVNARDGILLIDEFENGLHWSVQPQVWKTIFTMAERLNVQVFATTHSRDCIESFDNVWNEQDALGAFLRLDLKQDQVTVTEYTSETLTDSIDTDVEMR